MMASSIRQAPLLCGGHSRPVVDIYFSEVTDCGSLFITASKDGKAIMRNGVTGDWIGTLHGHQGAVWSCVLDAHATKAATGAADFTAKLWDTNSGQELLTISENHIVRCVDLSKTDSGAFLLTATNRKKLAVYDLTSPTEAVFSLPAHEQIIRRALWCNDDRCILTASEDRKMCLWSLLERSKKPVQTFPLWSSETTSGPITDLQFIRSPTPNNALMPPSTGICDVALVCGKTIEVFHWDWRYCSSGDSSTQVPEPIHTYKLPCTIYSVGLHPTNTVMVCGGEDHSIYRLDRANDAAFEEYRGHFGPVHCVRFSPDGHLFGSCSEDGTVRLWQTVVGEKYGLWDMAPTPVSSGTSSNNGTSSANTSSDQLSPSHATRTTPGESKLIDDPAIVVIGKA